MNSAADRREENNSIGFAVFAFPPRKWLESEGDTVLPAWDNRPVCMNSAAARKVEKLCRGSPVESDRLTGES